MSYQKLLQQMIGVTLVMLLLIGCGAPAATPTPIVIVVTATPVRPTATPQPTPTPIIIVVTATPQPTPTPAPPTATPTPVLIVTTSPPVLTATLIPCTCIARDGEWDGRSINFKVSNCQIIDSRLYFPARDPTGKFASITIIRIEEPIPIKDNKFSFLRAEGSGTLSVSGTFISATQAQGTWTLTKGAEVGPGRITEDVSFEWSASPK